MKIISVDNFDRDYIPDKLIGSGIDSEFGETMVAGLNETYGGEHSFVFFRLVADDYKLNEGE